MKRFLPLPVLIALIALAAGCGDDGETPTVATEAEGAMAKEDGAMEKDDGAMEKEEGAMEKDDGAMEEESAAKGTTVILGDSEFGEMIYDDNDQAIYVFERDTSAKSTCYDECAAAWPPVVTSDQPIAGEGVEAALLGTTKRRDGSLQVTYDGRPLYYYAHEGPGEVRCHNVDLNGGFWWVVGPDGEPLA
jgi:predicted lipoprotein with Yx(FWY)xxD motif